MADEFQDKLNNLLSNPELMKTIASLAGSIGSSSPQRSEDAPVQQTPEESEISANLASMVNSLSDSNDSRINLLYALKPYMRSGRAEHMDMAIKILKLTKLTSLL